ncbi:hypothetical protein AA313_de0208389 [Arthrobotrys entomopaga]|nr:hypothetical protein AA313_de0208389 [Arthrobotrys entomopaga]
MHSKIFITAFCTILSLVNIPGAAGHGLILSATGDAGTATSKGLGVDDSTPRDGTRRRPFQQDTTIFKGQRTVASAQGCGKTLEGGVNKIDGFTGTMAQVTQGGKVSMTLHQVNTDGAGPYTCMVNAAGDGQSFVQMQVTTQVPGRNGNNIRNQKKDLPLVAQLPANVQCTGTVGGMSNVCMVRCQNNARAGPFGGCIPVQMVGGSANTTAPAPQGRFRFARDFKW